MAEIKTVHCIVYPFYMSNSPALQKMRQWKRNILKLAKDPAAMVFIIVDSYIRREQRSLKFSNWIEDKMAGRAMTLPGDSKKTMDYVLKRKLKKRNGKKGQYLLQKRLILKHMDSTQDNVYL